MITVTLCHFKPYLVDFLFCFVFFNTRNRRAQSFKGEKSPHLVLSCSSRCWRKKSDSGVPGTPVALWLHITSSAPGLQTVYWLAAPPETLKNAAGKRVRALIT